jgi:hypothetical protein
MQSVSVATVLGLCTVVPAGASPVLFNTAAVKSAAENTVTEVRWGIRRGVARAAVATGVGLAVAGAARSYGYGYPYSYGPTATGTRPVMATPGTAPATPLITTVTAVTAITPGTRRDTTDTASAALPAVWRDAHTTVADRGRA